MAWGSIEERKKQFLEDMGCAGCGGEGGMNGDVPNSVGDDGFQGGAPAKGPRAGYDPLLGRTLKRMRNNRKRRLGV